MLLLDALIRISAITMLVFLAIAAFRDIRPSRSWLYLILASLSMIGVFFSLNSSQLALPNGLAFISGFLNVPHLIFVWLFALSVFQTKFRLSIWHIVLGLIYTFPIFWFRAYQFGLTLQPPFWLTIGVSIGSILLMLHLVWVIVAERNEDLVEERKRSRWAFVGVLILVTILTAIVDLYLIAVWPNWAHLIKAATIWPAVFAGSIWILRGSKAAFVVDAPKQTSLSNAQSLVSAKDRSLFSALQNSINEDRIYLDSNMTIAQLAKDLGVTSHRLRALINQSLGYENFNQFLNASRIKSILKTFDDPDNDHIPILTIALDNGFRSLSPFNKAFKDIMGQTPSQYRKGRG